MGIVHESRNLGMILLYNRGTEILRTYLLHYCVECVGVLCCRGRWRSILPVLVSWTGDV